MPAGVDGRRRQRASRSCSAPTPACYDGRFANNAWLQELPKSLTKLTWDNAALIAPGTAAAPRRSISGDVVELKQGGQTLRIPVWLAPGQALDTLTLHLGYGRTRAGRTGTGIGFDVNALRTADGARHARPACSSTKTGDSYELACTQDHWSLEGRNLIRVATQAQFTADPRSPRRCRKQPPKTPHAAARRVSYEGYAWGMAIDQNVCTGCNACVVACQAENNVPVVGKAQVAERPRDALAAHRPLLHRRPRQPRHLSPADAVPAVRDRRRARWCARWRPPTHSDEGLNDMVYNRCVGTRYCSNNCPYKVRRFNFLLYSDFDTPSAEAAAQPGRHGPQPRRDGEVHLLRAAHQPGARRGQARRSSRFATARW